MDNEWRRGLKPGIAIGICIAAFLLLNAPAQASASTTEWVAAMLLALLGPVVVATGIYAFGLHRLRQKFLVLVVIGLALVILYFLKASW